MINGNADMFIESPWSAKPLSALALIRKIIKKSAALSHEAIKFLKFT